MQNNTVKNDTEIANIKKAAEIIDDVFDDFLNWLSVGVTELELADKIEKKVLALGGSGLSFDTIVAFGENGCEPHHVPTDKRLEKGMFVTVDMGAVCNGYCSDFTRTVAFGDMTEKQIEIYNIVLKAYELAFDKVAAGVACKAVDSAARDYITACGYGDKYIHGTGHGVGKLIHEAPTLNTKSEEILKSGEVVTVEPGIYLPNDLGVRIENMVIVGNNKPFSRHTTQLITIK
ncbi:MAG: aminopeptidase P family protein [Clostridia bacterium]|nr:aminopeptidase P family protein [Clostridia bacterium]